MRKNQQENKKKRKAKQPFTNSYPLLEICQTSFWTPTTIIGSTQLWAYACASGLDAQLSYLKTWEPQTLHSQSQVLVEDVQGYQPSSQGEPLFPEHLFSIDQSTHIPIVVVHRHIPQELVQQKTDQQSDHPAFLSPEPTLHLDPLSPRELDVLRCLASGLSNREIAQRLVIAESTVKWHLKQIYGKLGASSRTQAISHARESNLIP